jgi:hypothetical protein
MCFFFIPEENTAWQLLLRPFAHLMCKRRV